MTEPSTGAGGTAVGMGVLHDQTRERIIRECFDEFGSKWIIDPGWDDNPDDPEDPDFWEDVVGFTIDAVHRAIVERATRGGGAE